MMNWKHELHIPPHSVDGQWRVIDAESDSGDVVAIIDPDDIAEGLGKSPEEYARLIAAAPAMAGLLHGVLESWCDEIDNDEPIAGSDAVEWLCGFYRDVEALIGKIVKDEPVAAEGGA